MNDKFQARAATKLDPTQAGDLYRLVVESIQDYAIFMLDSEGHVATWNEGARRAKGYESPQIIGHHFSEFYLPDERKTKPDFLLSEARRSGRAEDEGWRLRQDGTRFWANVVITALHDSSGELVGFAKVTRDLTERKKAEDDLRQTQQKIEEQARRFDTALSSSPDHYYLFDLEQRFIYVNQSLLELWGKSLDEVIGKTFQGLGYPQHLIDLHHRELNEVLTGKVVKAESSYTSPTGKFGYYEYTFSPVMNFENQVTAIAGTARDVTAERELMTARLEEQRNRIELLETEKREKALANERENFRNLFRQTPEMVCILQGPDHTFEFVNEAHIKALGFDATGLTVKAAQPESVEVHGILDEVYRTGVTAELREIPVTLGNRLRFFNLTYAARRDEKQQITGVMILGIEITEELETRKELSLAKEEAIRANQLKTAFLANVSHEIRTPLGAMIGFTDLLRDPTLTCEERESYIDVLARNGENLSVIINDILDLSKVEAGHLSLDLEESDPAQMVSEVMSLLTVKLKEKDLSFSIENDPSTPLQMVTDPVRVKQILLNIVGNAVKFTRTGGIKVRTFAAVSPEGKPQCCFEVQDTGIGIPESKWERVFEMFVQADNSTTRRFGGTGIGLALSRRLAQALGGDIKITASTPEQGTTFLITLEDQTSELRTPALPAREEISETDSNSRPLEGLQILVVDDSDDNQQLMWHYIRKFGGTAELAENGVAGYQKALKGNFDLVLMDIQMPIMDGYTATSKLRESGFDRPIIALTAHVLSDVRQKCLNVGCDDHLPKPINPKQLIQTIQRCLSRVS